MTNLELVTDMMSFSRAGALKEAFILEAIRVYSGQSLEAEPWPENGFISQAAWKQCATECLQTINNRRHIETINGDRRPNNL